MVQLASRAGRSGIRFLRPSTDLGQLADLIENAFGEELTDGGEQVLRELRILSWLGPLNILFAGMSSEVDGIFTGFVWEWDGKVVGNVTVNHPTGHPQRWQISNVAVHQACRRQGIGRQLVEAALDLILERGGRTAYLFVRDTNSSALGLYQSMGFREVDRTTDLKLLPAGVAGRSSELHYLRPLEPGGGEALYQLVSRALSAGSQWLSGVRREQYSRPAEVRLFQRVEALFSGKSERCWGIVNGDRLDAGISLQATHMWNHKPHRLKLWVHPDRRGQVESALARDLLVLLSREAPRAVWASVPGCERPAIEALAHVGFRKVRTLVLMRLDL